jgi:hypothetical protein
MAYGSKPTNSKGTETFMPRYVGLDLHKELIEACFIDEQGKHLRAALPLAFRSRCGQAINSTKCQIFVSNTKKRSLLRQKICLFNRNCA